MQGRANAALLLTAREMGAEFLEPPNENSFAGVQGRTHGCTFELRVADARDKKQRSLVLIMRHFHTQKSVTLDGAGLQPPDLDPVAMRRAVEEACYEFATND